MTSENVAENLMFAGMGLLVLLVVLAFVHPAFASWRSKRKREDERKKVHADRMKLRDAAQRLLAEEAELARLGEDSDPGLRQQLADRRAHLSEACRKSGVPSLIHKGLIARSDGSYVRTPGSTTELEDSASSALKPGATARRALDVISLEDLAEEALELVSDGLPRGVVQDEQPDMKFRIESPAAVVAAFDPFGDETDVAEIPDAEVEILDEGVVTAMDTFDFPVDDEADIPLEVIPETTDAQRASIDIDVDLGNELTVYIAQSEMAN